MQEQFITLADYLVSPLAILLVLLVAFSFRNRVYPVGHPWRTYFTTGLVIKIIGSIAIALIYQYNYGGGDTANYFYHAKIINSAFADNPIKWFNLVFHIPAWYDGDYSFYISQMYWYVSLSEYIVASITAVVGMLTGTLYLPTSILFAGLAFTGVWALFRTFSGIYQMNSRVVAICVLYIPSTVLWGSGIFKDTICSGCIGWLTYGIFRMLVLRDFSLKNVIATVISFFLIYIIKVYILMAFLPALFLWVVFNYLQGIGNRLLRFLVRLIMIGVCALAFVFFGNKFSDQLGKYSLDNVAQTSAVTRDWINQVSLENNESSGYTLGDFDPSIGSMIKKFPAAVNVTLFRPYLWETKKVITLLAALEALAFLLITIKVLLYVGPIRIWRAIADDPTVQFCLIFSLIFAFAVGISTYNFGALSRYRIPCLPFYGFSLVLIYYRYNPPEKNLFSLRP
jgi:hypothetical protein